MAMPATIPRYSPEEYLTLERAADYKSEYLDGHIYAMSGGSAQHSRIKVDLLAAVVAQVGGTRCEVFDSDMRVQVSENMYTYPDLTVVCGESRFSGAEHDVLLNPTVIFEVLSPSSEAYDRGEKWARYRRMPSLQLYVLVSQSKPLIEVFARAGDTWIFADAGGLDADLRLDPIPCTIDLGAVYARIHFEPDEV